MRRLFYSFVLAMFLWIFFAVDVSAWDTDTAHPYITSSVLIKATNLDRFLGDFGLVNERFDSQDLRDFGAHGAKGWIFLGSIWEDYEFAHAYEGKR